jgi:hypothetical protein
MIITLEEAANMTKSHFVDIASEYATNFARHLGSDMPIRINEDEIVYDLEEAKRVFLKKYEHIGLSNEVTKIFRKLYNLKLQELKEGLPFFEKGVTFIPIKKLADEEEELVRLVENPNKKLNVLKLYLKRISGSYSKYRSLFGLGAELAHLTGEKLYSDRIRNLGEALDISSTILEIKTDVRFLIENSNPQADLEKITEIAVQDQIDTRREELSLYETMILHDENQAREKIKSTLLKKGRKFNNWDLDFILRRLKADYISTGHYEGMKLFLEILDSTGGNLDQTNKRLGQIMANPQVKDMPSALRQLGYSDERLQRYTGAFQPSKTERFDFINRVKTA